MSFLQSHILSFVIFLPLLGACVVACLPSKFKFEIRIISLAFSAATLLLAAKLFASFSGAGGFDFQYVAAWVPTLGISYRIGLDGLSLLLVLLTAILVPITIGASWKEIRQHVKAFHALVLVTETAMIGTFAALDVFLFYVFWEMVLIPMYFIIGIWGTGNRIRSAIKFVIFTTLGSVIMLVAILYCQNEVGGTFDLISWYGHAFPITAQFWLFAAFALAFAIKVPIVPLHTWLPDAHTDAPTGGSILLAGVLLKMGGYGLYRFAIPLFPTAAVAASPYLCTFAVAAIIYGGLLALVQTDMKRLIAYSSVAHMGFVILGLFALEFNAVQGAGLQMFNHGITTGALFMMIGMLYGRTGTREIGSFGGAARTAPLLAMTFVIFALASAGLPGLSTFVGEFLVLLGSFQTRTYYSAVAILGVIIAAAYLLWLVQRTFFGPTKSVSEHLKDLDVREHVLIVPLIFIIIIMGVWPKPWLSRIESSSQTFLSLAARTIEFKEQEHKPMVSPPPPAPAEIEPAAEPEPTVEVQEIEADEEPSPAAEVERDIGGIDVRLRETYTVEQPAEAPEIEPAPKEKDKKVTLPPLPAGLDEEEGF